MPHSTDDLGDAELELQRAWLHADVIALEALLDDEVELLGPGGGGRAAAGAADDAGAVGDAEPRRKHDEIEGYRSGRVRMTAFEVERQRVRVIEELGTTDVIAVVAGRRNGEAFEQRLRFVRTWRLADGWVLVSSHASVVRARGIGPSALGGGSGRPSL